MNTYCAHNDNCSDNKKVINIFDELVRDNGSPKCKEEGDAAVPARARRSSYTGYGIADKDYYYSTGSSNKYEDKKPYTESKNSRILNTIATLGRWNESSTSALLQCSKSTYHGEWYQALHALRSAPCSRFDYASLLPLFRDSSITDNYQQIMIYRTLVRCHTPEFREFLAQKLRDEEVNQATSYIWTHITNLIDEEAWAAEIMKDSALIAKFQEPGLRFSRNFKENFIVNRKTFTLETNLIFSGYRLRPQYFSMQVWSKESSDEVFGIEFREANRTLTRYISPVDSYAISESEGRSDYKNVTDTQVAIDVRVMGSTVYSVKKYHGTFDAATEYLVVTVVEYGTRMFESFSFSFLTRMFTSNNFAIEYFVGADIDLLFPTSIGLPFHIKLNGTKGYHRENLFASYAKQIEAAMYIDAYYTNVGTKLIAQCNTFPNLNVSYAYETKRYMALIDMPELKNTLAEFKFSVYNVENDKLTPRYSSNESLLETMCIPGLKKLTGSTVCLDYCKKSVWWPVYNKQYHIYYDREEEVRGYNISARFSSTSLDLKYDVKGSPERTWSLVYHDLAQFMNIKLETPFFALNGSGTFRSEVICLKDHGRALNVSGTLRCNDDEAPFTLYGKSY